MGKCYNQRRLFMADSNNSYQLFKFDQHGDGSIYCMLPNFSDVIWQTFKLTDNGMMLVTDTIQKDGKLSLHGTGMVTFRANDTPREHKLIVKGNHLLNVEKGEIGVRHLFTIFSQEPQFIPASPALNRESDVVLKTDTLKPFAMVCFAIPSKSNFKVDIGAGFQVDDVASIPPESGFGGFGLRLHNVIWFYYRTKHMDKWPAQTHLCYWDGHAVPMFIGVAQDAGQGSCRLEVRKPIYKLEQDKLLINIGS
jgi:hypothetical protein